MSINIRDYLSDERRQIFDYDGGSMIVYIGKAGASAKTTESRWQIRKLTYSGTSVIQINFADGNSEFNKIWDNRTTYDYTPDS